MNSSPVRIVLSRFRAFFTAAAVVALLLRGTSVAAQVLPGVGMTTETTQSEIGAYRAKVQIELNSILTRWGELMEQKDSSALVGLYTLNARAVATGASDAWGARDVVDQLWHVSLAGAHLYVVIDDFDMSGDMAYVSTAITVNPTEAGGPPNSGIAHAFFVFVSDSRGRWHIRGQSLSLPKAVTG